MQRIHTLLQKIQELAQQGDKNTAIEVDLMMDYTRVLYADLIEIRNRLGFNQPEPVVATAPHKNEYSEPAADTTPERTSIPAPPEIKQEIPAQDTPYLPPAVTTQPVAAFQPPREITKTTNDIRNVIGINDKYQFISELFGNNKDAYEEVLTEISNFETYQQTTNWIEAQVFNQYGWEEENITVQNFYGVLRKFFSMI